MMDYNYDILWYIIIYSMIFDDEPMEKKVLHHPLIDSDCVSRRWGLLSYAQLARRSTEAWSPWSAGKAF